MPSSVPDLLGAQPDRDFLVISRGIEREVHYELTGLLQNAKKKNARYSSPPSVVMPTLPTASLAVSGITTSTSV
jgi:hypothetical protein